MGGTEEIEDGEDETGEVEEPPGGGVKLRRSSSDAEDVSDSRETRDTLGRLYEMKGDLKAAEEIRLKGLPDNIACGNNNVSL